MEVEVDVGVEVDVEVEGEVEIDVEVEVELKVEVEVEWEVQVEVEVEDSQVHKREDFQVHKRDDSQVHKRVPCLIILYVILTGYIMVINGYNHSDIRVWSSQDWVMPYHERMIPTPRSQTLLEAGCGEML